MRARAPRSSRVGGFSLIEVLAAFVILALVATALFQLFSGALQNASAAQDWSRAVLIAESRLTAAANAQPLVESSERGEEDEGRVRWETRVKAWEPVGVDPELVRVSDGMLTRLYRVEVDVHFPGLAGRERALSLATVKLAAKDTPR